MSEDNKYWFAIYTKPRWEKKVAKILDERGIENYCPLNKVVKQWSDRKKVIYEPIFKSYVFVKIPDEDKWDLKNINGVLNFVFWLGKPARIKNAEIQTIKKFLNDHSDVTVVQQNLEKNTTVRIRQGVLMNYEGQVVDINGNKATVILKSMGITLQANFEKKNLEVLLVQKN